VTPLRNEGDIRTKKILLQKFNDKSYFPYAVAFMKMKEKEKKNFLPLFLLKPEEPKR